MDEMNKSVGWNKQGGARKLYTCHKFDCDYSTFENLPKCPECGFPLYDAATFKVFGALLIACGVFLTSVGAGIGIYLQFRDPPLDSRAYVVYAVLGLLALAGIALMAGGFQQVVTGLKQTSFLTVFLILIVLLGILGAVIRFLVS